MRALLDEQLSPQVAVLLRERGWDVVAVAERMDLVARSDSELLEVAAIESRIMVTNNVKDFRPLAAARLAAGADHGGLLLLPSSRVRTRAAVTALADAIERELVAHPHGLASSPHGLASSERWIGPLSDD